MAPRMKLWPVGLVALGAISVFWPWLALPAGFASLVGVVALRRPTPAELPCPHAWLWTGVVLSTIGVVRFVAGDAMRGIVGGGRTAVEEQTISRLRDVLFAQDAMRRAGWIDPDRDGIGSAASLEELCGGPPARGQPARETPVLHCGELAASPLGPAARSGPYFYALCLPAPGGGWTSGAGPVEDEAAERRFVAVAWPEPASPFDQAFLVDEHENIRVATVPAAPGGGTLVPSSCASALDALDWQPWRGKKPRESLPGDSAPENAR